MTPNIAYLVCATQRSGSTVLCETLRATGVAGVPLEHFEHLFHSALPRQPHEYFDGDLAAELAPLLPAPAPARAVAEEPPARWWARIVGQGSTPNGAWGGKLMWDHAGDFVARARRLDGLASADLSQVLDRLLGDVVLVHVRREDTVAQAVSMWKALQTQSWRSETDEPEADVVYHHGAIDHLVGRFERQDAAWLRWFADTGRVPLTLVYEQIRDDPRQGVAQVLGALGLPLREVPEPPLDRQRDATSREWARRYRAERAEPDGARPLGPSAVGGAPAATGRGPAEAAA